MERIQLSPEANEILKLAIFAKHEGRLENAIELYRDVVRLEPKSLRAWQQIGYLLKNIGKSVEAQEAYETALALDPANLVTIRSLALIHLKSGRHVEAEKLLQGAIARHAQGTIHRDMCIDLSHILLLQKRWDEAKAVLLDAVLADPASLGAYYNLAYLYYSTGKWDETLSICIKLLTIQPNVEDAHTLIQLTLRNMNRGAVADRLSRKAQALRSEENKIKQQWSDVVGKAQNDLRISPFRFELFLPPNG